MSRKSNNLNRVWIPDHVKDDLWIIKAQEPKKSLMSIIEEAVKEHKERNIKSPPPKKNGLWPRL